MKNPDGSVYEAPGLAVARRRRTRARASSPTSASPPPASGGAGCYKSLLDLGVAGIWNDMNEPAVFDDPDRTPCRLDVRHDNEGQPTDHREIHNVYGLLMTRGRPTRGCRACGRTSGRSS